ncbi:hypothetical protein KQH49_06835 [Mycetohabitans sp. B5]|uniref:Uncharacterized protein n=1 Tax=Mycetohabitans endofungorum TaxID=417203 RepID=A0A2P5KA53_9BURK|nr:MULTISPECIES: hypothetical protein [Mycetohabitans]MCG1054685.1 hypothetical protein [Mycetohabitans sp. B5]PPB83569.1 hypothetical protein B0O95_10785 [Mycetohabitans endofungorum]
MNGDNQALHEFCLRWVEWSRTRRLYAPLRPKNILLRLREPAGLSDERDAELDAALNLFNMALMAYPEGRSKQAFMAFYLGQVRPIKRAAYELGYSRMGFFKAVRRVRENVYAASRRLTSGLRMQERTEAVR